VSEVLLGPSVPSIVGLGRKTHCGFVAGMLDLIELDQIGLTCAGIFVDAVEMRFIPEARPLQFRRPPRSARSDR